MSATPRHAVVETVFATVHDTTVIHDTTVVHDTLTQFLGSVPRMLDVRVHDSFGGKDVLTTIVQLVVGVGGACLGAWLGGKMASEAASQAIADEWKLERSEALRRLMLRVKSNLRRVELLVAQYGKHDVKLPFAPEVGEELEVVWNLYYRVSEPIFSLGKGDLSERLDAYFVRTHTLAESIKAFEGKAREIDMEVVRDTGGHGHAALAKTKLPKERELLLNELRTLADEATVLLREVREVSEVA